jgi:anti-sigma factor RsiW
MLIQQHPSSLLSDYVLDLLSLSERRKVEQHLAFCPRCRAAVQEERALVRDVRATLVNAADAAPTRLRQLMPEPPQRRTVALEQLFWRPVAAMALVLVLFIGLTQWNQPGAGAPFVQPSATTMASTVTHTPTATVTSISAKATKAPDWSRNWPLQQPESTPLSAVPLLLASR